MRVRYLAIPVFLAIFLAGCGSLHTYADSSLAEQMKIGRGNPRGTASYLEGQRLFNAKDYSGAKDNYCRAADLGLARAKKPCADATIIDSGKSLNKHTNYFFVASAEMSVCNVKDMSSDAASLCRRLKATDNTLAKRRMIRNKAKSLLAANGPLVQKDTSGLTSPSEAKDGFEDLQLEVEE